MRPRRRDRHACIPDHRLRVGRTGAQERETRPGQLRHHRIDFEERPILRRQRIAGERPRPQPDHADPPLRSVQRRRNGQRAADARRRRIIGRRLLLALGRSQQLDAMQRRAMRQRALVRILGQRINTEIAARADVARRGDAQRVDPAEQQQRYRQHRDIGRANADRGQPHHRDHRKDQPRAILAKPRRRPPLAQQQQQRADRAHHGQRGNAPAAPPQRPERRQQDRLRHQRARRQDQQRIFPCPVEQPRRDQPGEQPAQRPADRHGQVETRQPLRRGAQPVHRGMQRHRDHEQQRQRQQQPQRGLQREPADHHPAEQDDGDRRHARDEIGRRAPVGKGDAEAEEVQPQRQHPQQRHGDDIGGDIGRRREHQPRRDQRQRDPHRDPPPARWAIVGDGLCTLHRRVGQPPRDRGDQRDQQQVPARPQPALPGDRHQRLDQQGISE